MLLVCPFDSANIAPKKQRATLLVTSLPSKTDVCELIVRVVCVITVSVLIGESVVMIANGLYELDDKSTSVFRGRQTTE